MVEADQDDGAGQGSTSVEITYPPASVSLTPFRFRSITSPSPHRLCSNFTHLGNPISSARKLAWVSLQGRLVNAEAASSARVIKGGLSLEEAVSWQLFTPIQRFLIVAIIGVAVAESKKNRLLSQLKKSVEIRDEVLFSMQQKLDNLCEQLYYVKEQQGIMDNISLNRKTKSSSPCENFGSDKINFVDCGCWLCDQHHNLLPGLVGNAAMKSSSVDEVLHCEMTHANEAEQEERRLSYMSDYASSVTSNAEIQMNHFSIEQDIFNLRKESEEKDAIIKKLNDLVQSSNVTGSKRISELEDIIRRKNMIITRLKRDMAVLEQKVVQLTRQKRSSSSAASASAMNYWVPVMVDNVVYDMDSTTSAASSDADSPPVKQPVVPVTKFPESPNVDSESCPLKQPAVPVAEFPDTSSSDSDSPPVKQPELPVAKFPDTPLRNFASSSTSGRKYALPKVSSYWVKPTGRLTKLQAPSPLQERSTNQKSRSLSSLRQKQSPTRGEFKKTKRRTQPPSKDAGPPKRWV